MQYTDFLGRTSEEFNFGFSTISIVDYMGPVSEEWHCHENIHLSLILQGGNLESRKKEDVQVTTGKVMFYQRGEQHRNRHTLFPSKNLNLEFRNDFFSDSRLRPENIRVNGYHGHTTFLTLMQVYNELRLGDKYTNDAVLLSIQGLFAPQEQSSCFRPLWLNQLEVIIEDRWNEFIPLNELAGVLNVHPVTISKYFRRYFRGTLGDYMRKIKLKRALDYLFHSKKSISEIAFLCGFSDHSHMDRIFKTYVGFRPKEIRSL